MARTTRHLATAAATAAAMALLAGPAVGQIPPPAQDGTITNAAGTTPGFAGDGGPAGRAQLDTPRDVAFTSNTSFLIADVANDRIREVRADGTIDTVAGSSRGLSGDGGPAVDAQLDRPRGVTSLPGGGYLIADTFNDRIRKVAPDGTITTVAGTSHGLAGDGGPATAAQLSQPSDIAVLPGGGFLIADTGNSRIRKVAPDGTITTVAGSTQGFGGDGGPATAAALDQPRDVTVASDGAILIADTANNRIRRVAPDGTITTVAGAGAGLAGDGDPARNALLRAPFSVAALPHGGFLFADTANNRVRRVTPLGAIFTVAGTAGGNAGDGGLAKSAQLNQPGAVTIAPTGGFLVADTGNATVRRVTDIGAIPPAVPSRSVNVTPVANGTLVLPAGTPSFQPLLEKDLVPTGSQVDATTGMIAVTSALDVAGTQQTAQLFEGAFAVTQITNPAQGLVTQFRLASVTDCRTATARGVTARSARVERARPTRTRKRKKRRPSKSRTRHSLWVRESGGHWRTASGSVSAAAIGTEWHTTLTCAGTRVGVHQGIVAVRDRIHQKTVVLHAGQTRLFASSSALEGS